MTKTHIFGSDVLTIPVKILLFLYSYVPLYIILILLNHQYSNIVWFFALLSIVVLSLFLVVYRIIVKISGEYLKINKVENINRINIEYLVTYLLPFLNINLNDVYSAVSAFIFFFIIGFVYINSDMLYTNPTLNLMGFNIFKCQTDRDEVIVIARKDKNEIKQTEIVQIGSNIYIGK